MFRHFNGPNNGKDDGPATVLMVIVICLLTVIISKFVT